MPAIASATRRRPIAAFAVMLVLAVSSCHGSTAPTGVGGRSFNHIFMVVEENTDYTSVIGSSSMPYLNGLAQQYGLATQYYANTHPSIGNYFMMTVGKIITNDDPFTQFATDLATNALPNYSFIVPNLCNDAHDCSLSTADTWLQTNIDPLVKSAQFQQDGLLIILFDEAGGDDTNGGGRVAWVAGSAHVKPGYQSTRLYQHASTLRLSLKALGVTALPNGAATAPDMDEFFNP